MTVKGKNPVMLDSLSVRGEWRAARSVWAAAAWGRSFVCPDGAPVVRRQATTSGTTSCRTRSTWTRCWWTTRPSSSSARRASSATVLAGRWVAGAAGAEVAGAGAADASCTPLSRPPLPSPPPSFLAAARRGLRRRTMATAPARGRGALLVS
eukprot:scaffold2547_cov299-Prasinococcus_capsulatus_cf.AAC.5